MNNLNNEELQNLYSNMSADLLRKQGEMKHTSPNKQGLLISEMDKLGRSLKEIRREAVKRNMKLD